ncbi:hypothetical protein [Methanobrevibacter sp.]|uniref:hypothetical protein n=1 Tax=Methanobrevibacter sp. TaxID=66852 RepID=UPI0038645D75
MNGITILIWITIAIIGIIAIILVKLHYGNEELEHDEGSIIPSSEAISGILSQGKERITSTAKNNSPSQTTQNTKSLYGNRPRTAPDYDVYIVPEEYENMKRFEYESENQILINYGNEVKKFQEPIKQSQMDIMNQNKEDKTELKDLFTIDELIKESKRKDNEREKESQNREDDAELDQIKESIKQRKESNVEEPLIEEVVSESETIEDIIKEDEAKIGIANAIAEEEEEAVEEEVEEKVEVVEEEAQTELEMPQASQKDIEEAITAASKESEEEEIESISEDENITEVLLSADDDELDIPNEEIKEPTLKTPSKVSENKSNEIGASSNDDSMDLDYRKDLDKITNRITSSKIFQDVKEKLIPETEEVPPRDDEDYIRNVNRYDEFEPIINETHVDYGNLHDDYDQKLRQENTRRVFNMAKNSPEPELAQPKVGGIKEKPVRENIKVTIGNAEFVVKKGDEIIFNHLGETYSSQVYAITGDDIHVRYRRQNITIKPEDVKKVY